MTIKSSLAWLAVIAFWTILIVLSLDGRLWQPG